jgi:DNA modification methylase
MEVRDRIKELRRVRGRDLRTNPHKWRKHPKSQAAALTGALEEIGYAGAVLARELADGSLELLDGHLRAELTPDALVPVLVLDVDDAEAKKLIATFDPLGAMATIGAVELEALLKEVETGNEALKKMLADLAKEAEKLLPREVAEDAVPDLPQNPITNSGDLWLLGRHKLLCGDATVGKNVARLFGGDLAAMVFTDPPYNVGYVGKTSKQLTIQNDSMSHDSFGEFLQNAFDAMAAGVRPGGAIYVCHADSEGLNFRRAMREAGWLLKQCLIWVKNAHVLGRQDYQWKHEPILYGWKPGAAHQFYGGRRQTTIIDGRCGVEVEQDGESILLTITDGKETIVLRVPAYEVVEHFGDEGQTLWHFDRPARNADHPTMKPVGLPARAIRNSSLPGEIVLDSFLGSGATLSAAEQMDRRCYGLELDPKYCDVIVERWENLTGQKATRETP